MKVFLRLGIGLLVVGVIGLLVLWPNESEDTDRQLQRVVKQPERLSMTVKPSLDPKHSLVLPLQQRNGYPYVSLTTLKQKLRLSSKPNVTEGTLRLQYGKSVHQLWAQIPVVNTNGIYSALAAPVLLEKGTFWLPIDLLTRLTGHRPQLNGQQALLPLDKQKPVMEPYVLPKLTAEKMIDYLSFLHMPGQGWKHLSTAGAKPSLQSQNHQPSKLFPITSPADGVVVRVERAVSKVKQRTVDQQRSPQMWVQYDKGVLIRFWHLANIPATIKPGSKVKQGTLLGKGSTLKFDLQIYGKPLEKLLPAGQLQTVLNQLCKQPSKPTTIQKSSVVAAQ